MLNMNNSNDTIVKLLSDFDYLQYEKQGNTTNAMKYLELVKGSKDEEYNLRLLFYCQADGQTTFKISIKHTESNRYIKK